MKRSGRIAILILVLGGVWIGGWPAAPTGNLAMERGGLVRPAWAEDEWRKEFDAVCGLTNDAMNFDVDQLKALVDRCDKLKPAIEALEPSARKVFLKRLQLCRDLYAYVLESKKSAGPKKE